MTTPPSEALRARWLEALLPLVPFEGWTQTAANTAACAAGLSPGEQALAAPQGIRNLVEAWFDRAEEDARSRLSDTDLCGLGVRDRVKAGLKAWLGVLEPDREAVRRAVARGFLPWAAGDAAARTWSVADMVWTAAGDTATDYNRYSKRGLLAGTIPLIVLRWLDETDEAALDRYISRRLTTAMQAGRAGGRIAGPLLSAFGRLRKRA